MRERRYRPYKKRCRQTGGTLLSHLLTFSLPFLPPDPLHAEPAIPGTPAGLPRFRSRRECQGGCTGQCAQSHAAEYRDCWWASFYGPSWLFPPVRYEIFKVRLCVSVWSALAAWLPSENGKCRRLSSCGLIGVCIFAWLYYSISGTGVNSTERRYCTMRQSTTSEKCRDAVTGNCHPATFHKWRWTSSVS